MAKRYPESRLPLILIVFMKSIIEGGSIDHGHTQNSDCYLVPVFGGLIFLRPIFLRYFSNFKLLVLKIEELLPVWIGFRNSARVKGILDTVGWRQTGWYTF